MKKLLLTLFCFCAFINATFAQNIGKIDSLSTLLEITDVSTRIGILTDIAWEYRLFYPDSTIYYCQKAINLADEYHLEYGIAKAYNFIGIASMYKGDYSNAFNYHFKALDIASQTNDSIQIAHSYNNLGRIFFNQGDLVKSYDHFFRALNIFEKVDELQGIGYCYQSLAKLYQLQNDTAKAIEMLQKALVIRINLSDDRGQISTYQELANLVEIKKDFKQAHQYFSKAEEISIRIGDHYSLIETELGIAELYFDQKNFDEALKYCQGALLVANDTENKKLLADVFLTLGKIYFAQRSYDQAGNYLTKVIILAEENGILESQQDAYFYLSQLHELSGNYKKSLGYHHRYVAIKDSLQNIDKARDIEKLESRLVLAKKQGEYDFLKSKEASDQLVIAQQKAKNQLQSILIVLVSVLLIVLYFAYSKRIEKNKVLAQQKVTIEQQSKQIIEKNRQIRNQNVVLRTRNETLDELIKEKDNLISIVAHDLKSPFNSIVSLAELGCMVGDLNPEHQKCFSLIKKVAFGGIHLIRDLLDANAFENSQLYQPKEIHINQYLKENLQAHRTEADLKEIKIHHLQSEAIIYLKTDPLYLSRIIDNLISNSLKYSKSDSNIFVKAYQSEDGQINMSIKDEGQGFSEDDKKFLFKKFKKLSAQPTNGEVSHGLGLAIVKTLVDRLHGEIELISEKGKGSEFIITFFALDEVYVNKFSEGFTPK